ncbi:MAG: type II secretion system protein [Desulfamplus sp.]|nr:type II secretion system protein [Desulfamplus sp.]
MRYSFKFHANSKGFTLIEIVVVMILIAIAGSLVFINIGQSGRMKESRIFASKVVSMCKTARITAMSQAIPTCLTISPESRECKISFIDSATPPYPQSSAFSETLKIPENILLEGENIKVDSDGLYFICFYPDGSSGGGILTISVENEFEFTFQVDILTGAIREIPSSDV